MGNEYNASIQHMLTTPPPEATRAARDRRALQESGGRDPNRANNTARNIYDPSLYNVKFNPQMGSNNLYSADADVRRAQTYLNQYNFGNDRGNNITRNEPGVRLLYEQAANKVALKKALAQSITNAPGSLAKQQGLLKYEAGEALGSGLSETRKNYNNRGLLYSGLRSGGEQQVKTNVASGLARNMSAAKKETSDLISKQKAAFAAIGLADQEKKNQMAQDAFDQSYKNSIARRQATQELGQSFGQLAGYAYGSGSGQQATAQTGLNQPSLGSQYAYNPDQYSLGSYSYGGS